MPMPARITWNGMRGVDKPCRGLKQSPALCAVSLLANIQYFLNKVTKNTPPMFCTLIPLLSSSVLRHSLARSFLCHHRSLHVSNFRSFCSFNTVWLNCSFRTWLVWTAMAYGFRENSEPTGNINNNLIKLTKNANLLKAVIGQCSVFDLHCITYEGKSLVRVHHTVDRLLDTARKFRL
jgi:hypothetical protein